MSEKSYRIKRGATEVVVHLARYVMLIACGYVLLYPFLYMIAGTFKGLLDVNDPTVNWIPKHFSMESIQQAMKYMDYWRSFGYTVLYGAGSVVLQFCTSALAAYGLARFKFKGRTVLVGMMMLTILVPAIMIIIPQYVLFYKMDFLGILGLVNRLSGVDLRLNLLDTPFAFWIPSALGVGLKGGLFIYIFMQFFKSLPNEIEEAAWIDGAGPFKTFTSLVIPSSSTAVVTVLIFSVVWNWSDSFLPSMFLTTNYPLSVQLENLYSYMFGTSNPGPLLAGCLLFLLPAVLFYVLLQKKFIASISTSGLTGM